MSKPSKEKQLSPYPPRVWTDASWGDSLLAAIHENDAVTVGKMIREIAQAYGNR